MFSKIITFAAFMVAATEAGPLSAGQKAMVKKRASAAERITAGCQPERDDGTASGKVGFVQGCDGGPVKVFMKTKTGTSSARVAILDEDPMDEFTNLDNEAASLGSWFGSRRGLGFANQRLDDFQISEDDLIGAYVAIFDGDNAEDGSPVLISSCMIEAKGNTCEPDDGERL